jgi:hypothetical protein
MLLVAILVLTNTVSADGSISGVYNASLLLAERTSGKASAELKAIEGSKQLVSPEEQKPVPSPPAKESTEQQKEQDKSSSKANGSSNNR